MNRSVHTFRTRSLSADDNGAVTVTLECVQIVGGVATFPSVTFTTLDPPNLGDEFYVAIMQKEQ